MKSSPRGDDSANRALSLGALSVRYLLLFMVVLGAASFLPDIDPRTVWSQATAGGEEFVFWHELRFRRLVYASAVGALLGLAGALFQAVLRNPLAEPYILGISGAAALGALLVRVIAPVGVAAGIGWITFGPLVGALLGTGLLLSLARWGGWYDPPSLILAGAVLNAIFGALILLVYSLAPEGKVVSSLFWLMGNIHAQAIVGTPALPATLLALAIGGGIFTAFARPLDLLSLGDEEAQDLGLSPGRVRLIVLVGASLLTGVVVGFAGPIGFIGLVVPHIMRRLHGPMHRRLLPLSMFGGALFLVIADTLARCALDRPLPIGVVTALVGGPFFLFLLGSYRRREGLA